jgi:hypothetical protein
MRTLLTLQLLIICSVLSYAQNGNSSLKDDNKYYFWISAGAGPHIQTDRFPIALQMQAEGNFEMLNGIATLRYLPARVPFITMYPVSHSNEYSLLYGIYRKKKAGVMVHSAGLSYLNGSKVNDDGDEPWPYTSHPINTLGIALQSTYYLTFGAGYALGFGVSGNINPEITYAGINLNLAFGYFYSNR